MKEKKSIWKFYFKEIEKNFVKNFPIKIISNYLFQSNLEGEIVDKIQNARNNQDGLIINAGGYTHILL